MFYWSFYGGADYLAHANDEIVVFAMIETKQALDNLDQILSVEGLDAVYIGPSDLSLALGCKPSFDDPEKPVVEAIDHILERAKARCSLESPFALWERQSRHGVREAIRGGSDCKGALPASGWLRQ